VKTTSAAPTLAFAGAARRYWLEVFPRLRREQQERGAAAERILDPRLREPALAALRKWGNVEGAVAFATLAPRAHRATAADAMGAFQAAYNYLDMLAERSRTWPGADPGQLHMALVDALLTRTQHLDAPPVDYYGAIGGYGDGGYLEQLAEDCRDALARLPSWASVAPAAGRAAERIVAFQAASNGEIERDRDALRAWGDANVELALGLRWWEAAAAAGSSLEVFALIALAAHTDVDAQAIVAIDRAYFPWIGALHSLLDNLVDLDEDHASGQHSLFACYASADEARERIRMLARRALEAARVLPQASGHVLILAAMASFYLSAPQARSQARAPVRAAVLSTLGLPARLSMLVFRARRAAGRQPC
jgi:tetraprenyl-beta-curcumene synthase